MENINKLINNILLHNLKLAVNEREELRINLSKTTNWDSWQEICSKLSYWSKSIRFWSNSLTETPNPIIRSKVFGTKTN